MNPPIPRRMIYSVIDSCIVSLDKKKDEILQDKPRYAFMQSGLIPSKPESGYTLLFFVHNDLEVCREFDRRVLPLLRKFAEKEGQ